MTDKDFKNLYVAKIDAVLSLLNKHGVKKRTYSDSFEIGFGEDESVIDRATIEECFFATLQIFTSVYGPNSPQIKTLLDTKKSFLKSNYMDDWKRSSLAQFIKGALLNAKDDLSRGLIMNLERELSGIIIGDFIALAKDQLRSGYKDVSAVLIAAAFEDFIKREAVELGLNIEKKDLAIIVNALKAKGIFSGVQSSLVSSYIKTRNAAMHADWEKISESEVNSLIGFLESLLLGGSFKAQV